MIKSKIAFISLAVGVISFAFVMFREQLQLETNTLIFFATGAIITISLGSSLLILLSLKNISKEV